MFCRNCGKEISDIASICVGCGVKKNAGNNYCNNCGKPTDVQAQFCTSCGVKLAKSVSLNIEGANGEKSKILAALLGIFLGSLGIHRFYLGYTGIGVLQLVLTFITCGITSIWGFIEGILILCGSVITTDAKGKPLV